MFSVHFAGMPSAISFGLDEKFETYESALRAGQRIAAELSDSYHYMAIRKLARESERHGNSLSLVKEFTFTKTVTFR